MAALTVFRARSTLFVALVCLVGACSEGGGVSVEDASPITTTASTSTTSTASTTTITATTVPEETTTTVAPQPVYPLTGLPVVDPVVAGRPALVVKIDNARAARPQTGFNAADLVIEEIVNDQLTRFAMVFHSQGSDPVGPIRSGRLQDIDLFGSLNRPLFAWSGGNPTVDAAIGGSDLIDLGPNRADDAYYRSRDRARPHNLYSNTSVLWTYTPFGITAPAQQFAYRGPGLAPRGVPAAGIALELDSIEVRWDWDAASGRYLRTMEGDVHEDAAGGPVTTENVVVLVMEYVPGISNSPDAQTIGTGEAFVATGGNVVHGTWTRADRLQPFTLVADDGTPIALTPGRSFIELPRPGFTLPLP
jgi:Protein of unknown function (DUF3048) N-terminal domain/Protein of unknown function (DUF3048) C-terminal domain